MSELGEVFMLKMKFMGPGKSHLAKVSLYRVPLSLLYFLFPVFVPWNNTVSISIHQQQQNQTIFARKIIPQNQQQQLQRFRLDPSETDETSLHHTGESQKKQWLAPGVGGMMPPPMFGSQRM